MKTPRFHHSKRRLAIEQVENRLMLSGDGLQVLDTSTFNLDQLAPSYVVFANDSSDSFAPILNANVDRDATFDLSGESASAAPLVYRIERPTFILSAAILRDMSNRVREFAKPYEGQVSANALGDFGGLSSTAGLNSVTITVFSAAGVELPWGLEAKRSIDSYSFKLLSESGSSLGSVIHVGLQSPIADSLSSPDTMPTAPVVGDRLVDFLAAIGDVNATVPVETLRPAHGANWLVVAPVAPTNAILAIRNSDAQIDVGQIIDELLPSGSDYVDHSMPDDLKSAENEIELTENRNNSGADGLFNAPVDSDGTQFVNAPAPIDEGGMISVQGIVGQLAHEMVESTNRREVIAADVPAVISGELARVAVMELIEGAADPAAPDSAADHTYLVAADDADFVPVSITLGDLKDSQAAFAAVRIVVDQAALAASMAAPANPLHLAALATAVGDAFATAASSAPLSASAILQDTGDARSLAFSEWDDTAQRQSREEESDTSYGVLSLVGVLAIERVVAAKRKRKNGNTSHLQAANAAAPQQKAVR